MSLVKKVKEDLVAARKARTDNKKVMLLNTLVSEIEMVGKNAGNRESTDTEALAVVRKFVKNAQQSIDDLRRTGRDTGDIQYEIQILESYLPAAVPEADVEAAVREIIAANAEMKPKDLKGVVIKGLKERYGAAFDGRVMSAVTNRILEG